MTFLMTHGVEKLYGGGSKATSTQQFKKTYLFLGFLTFSPHTNSDLSQKSKVFLFLKNVLKVKTLKNFTRYINVKT